MESKVNYFLVGLFVLLLGGALVFGILWFSVGGFYQTYERYLVFTEESVTGLSVDAQVSFKGVPVGRVADISVDPHDPSRVRLLLEVEPQTPVRADTEAVLRMQGLTGLLSVDLAGSSDGSPRLETPPGRLYPVIRNRPSLITHLGENVFELLVELKQTARNLNQLLNAENREALSQTLADLRALSGTLAGKSDTLAQGVDDLAATMANARAASDALPELVANVREASVGMPELVARYRETAKALERMANELAETGDIVGETVASNAGDLRRFTRDTLPETAVIVDELFQAAQNFRKLSEQLERNPGSLLFGGPKRELGPGE